MELLVQLGCSQPNLLDSFAQSSGILYQSSLKPSLVSRKRLGAQDGAAWFHFV
jgi:hypothetical protein